MKPLVLAFLIAVFALGCSSSGNGNGDQDGNGGVDANGTTDQDGTGFWLFVDTSALVQAQATFLKGRCVARLTIDAKTPEAQAALEAFARHLADPIPLDGSQPASDRELTELVPRPPLSGDLSGWMEDLSDGVEGPYLETSDAYEWINGAAAPFQDNGFEAVVEEYYLHETDGWSLEFDLVNMGTPQGAQAAFTGASWNTGTQIEG
jgi:hypothetical protein